MLRHHAFWHEAHDETRGETHDETHFAVTQAGLGCMLCQAKLVTYAGRGALSTPAELLKMAIGLFKILGCWAM